MSSGRSVLQSVVQSSALLRLATERLPGSRRLSFADLSAGRNVTGGYTPRVHASPRGHASGSSLEDWLGACYGFCRRVFSAARSRSSARRIQRQRWPQLYSRRPRRRVPVSARGRCGWSCVGWSRDCLTAQFHPDQELRELDTTVTPRHHLLAMFLLGLGTNSPTLTSDASADIKPTFACS